MANMYEAGEKVRVRADLNRHKEYGGQCVVGSMLHLAGREVTIKKAYDHHSEMSSNYTIKENDCGWTNEMFEPIDANKVFKAYLDGHIDEKAYRRITEETQ